MKMSKLIFSMVLLVLMTTPAFGKGNDSANRNHQLIEKKFISILNSQWGVPREKVSGESYFLRDFGADSVDISELVMALEEGFDIGIYDQEWGRITTVNSAVGLIVDKTDSGY